jgi:hypothetical protein
MLVSEEHTQPYSAASAPRFTTAGAGADLIPQPSLALPPQAIPHLQQLRAALARYRTQAAAPELVNAFAAATALVGTMVTPHGGRPELEEMRRLAGALPEFDELLSSAATEAERVVCAGTTGLWRALGLRSTAPAWSPSEHEAARMVFACACAPVAHTNPSRLQDGLRALAAPRFATLLCRELAESEDAWTHALGDRYESVRHRCARRTTWRSLGLSELLRGDETSRKAVATRIERWLADGGLLPTLAGELEAAIVHARTPARFA